MFENSDAEYDVCLFCREAIFETQNYNGYEWEFLDLEEYELENEYLKIEESKNSEVQFYRTIPIELRKHGLVFKAKFIKIYGMHTQLIKYGSAKGKQILLCFIWVEYNGVKFLAEITDPGLDFIVQNGMKDEIEIELIVQERKWELDKIYYNVYYNGIYLFNV